MILVKSQDESTAKATVMKKGLSAREPWETSKNHGWMEIFVDNGVTHVLRDVLFGFVLACGLRFYPNSPWPTAPGGAWASEGRRTPHSINPAPGVRGAAIGKHNHDRRSACRSTLPAVRVPRLLYSNRKPP